MEAQLRTRAARLTRAPTLMPATRPHPLDRQVTIASVAAAAVRLEPFGSPLRWCSRCARRGAGSLAPEVLELVHGGLRLAPHEVPEALVHHRPVHEAALDLLQLLLRLFGREVLGEDRVDLRLRLTAARSGEALVD